MLNQNRNLAIQGYCLDSERQRELRLGLRFPTGAGVVLVTAGLLLQSPLVLAVVAAIGAVAGFAPRHPFDLVWNHGVGRLTGAPPLPPNPVRRRHAFKFAAAWLLVVAGLFWAGQPLAATVLGGLALPVGTLVTVVHLCVFSEILNFYDHHRINQGVKRDG